MFSSRAIIAQAGPLLLSIQLIQFLYRVTAPGIRVPAVLSRQLQPDKSFATPG
jgi:hypothetical protein